MKPFNTPYIAAHAVFLFLLLVFAAALAALWFSPAEPWVSIAINAVAVGFFAFWYERQEDQILQYGPIIIALFNIGVGGWYLSDTIQVGNACVLLVEEGDGFTCPDFLVPLLAVQCVIHVGLITTFSVFSAYRFFTIVKDGAPASNPTDGKVI